MNLERFENVLRVQSETYNQWRMFAYIIRQLKEIGCVYYVKDGCIYVTKGTSKAYPCMVSHMDTVHNITSDLSIIKYGHKWTGFNTKTMTQTGIGGDDKVGIFIALECLREFDNIKAVFFRDEECGCDGSYNAHMPFFNDCAYVLQCDRRGYGDFVTNASGTQLSSKEFLWNLDWILKKWRYKPVNGMMTDVMALKECGLDICAANISCGYYNPHMENEYVHTREVEACLDFVRDIIHNLGETRFDHVYVKPKPVEIKGKKSKTSKDVLDKYFSRTFMNSFKPDPRYDDLKEYCECCGESVYKVEFVRDHQIDMCDKCIQAYCPDYVADKYL